MMSCKWDVGCLSLTAYFNVYSFKKDSFSRAYQRKTACLEQRLLLLCNAGIRLCDFSRKMARPDRGRPSGMKMSVGCDCFFIILSVSQWKTTDVAFGTRPHLLMETRTQLETKGNELLLSGLP